MDLNYTPYNIVSPSCVMAPGAPAEIEPEEDDYPSLYIVRVYINYPNEVASFHECALVESFGRVRLKMRRTLHGQEAAWSGDCNGLVDEHPELETLCDRAKAAVEHYFKDKSAAWWHRVRFSALHWPGFGTLLSVRLPRRKGYIIRARVERDERVAPIR